MKKLSLDKEFIELYNKGLNDSEIAKELKIGHVSCKRIRESLNLPSLFKYKRKFDTNKFKELYELNMNDTEISRELKCSISAIQNYRKSLNLKSNEFIFDNSPLTYEEEQILIGGLLGDLYLGIPKKGVNASGSFAHTTEKQKEYCWWKYEKLKRFCRKPFDTYQDDKRTGKRYYKTYCDIYTNPLLNYYHSQFYPLKEKIVSKKLLYKLDGLGLATWYMDDGTKCGNAYRLCTNSFNKDSLKLIVDFFKENFNINCTISSDNTIYIPAKETPAFKELIEPFIIESMKYKL